MRHDRLASKETSLPEVRGTVTTLKDLVGSGDRIALLLLPFLIVGVTLNVLLPSVFRVAGPPAGLSAISIAVGVAGVTIWSWSVALILAKVPRGELITSGPYVLVKHPLYTAVALLVVPWIGLLCNTWLGAPIGVVMYIGSRWFAPAEEAELSRKFGAEWDRYSGGVWLPWL